MSVVLIAGIVSVGQLYKLSDPYKFYYFALAATLLNIMQQCDYSFSLNVARSAVADNPRRCVWPVCTDDSRELLLSGTGSTRLRLDGCSQYVPWHQVQSDTAALMQSVLTVAAFLMDRTLWQMSCGLTVLP